MNFEWIKEIDPQLKEKFAKILPAQIMSLYLIDGYYLVVFGWGSREDDSADQNAWKVDENFNVIWKIEKYFVRRGINERVPFPYTGAAIKDGELVVRNYYGVDVKLDFETGKITNIPGQRPW